MLDLFLVLKPHDWGILRPGILRLKLARILGSLSVVVTLGY